MHPNDVTYTPAAQVELSFIAQQADLALKCGDVSLAKKCISIGLDYYRGKP